MQPTSILYHPLWYVTVTLWMLIDYQIRRQLLRDHRMHKIQTVWKRTNQTPLHWTIWSSHCSTSVSDFPNDLVKSRWYIRITVAIHSVGELSDNQNSCIALHYYQALAGTHYPTRPKFICYPYSTRILSTKNFRVPPKRLWETFISLPYSPRV